MKRLFLTSAPLVLVFSAAGARALPPALLALPSTDSRIRAVLYVPNQVVRIRAWVGYHIDVEFEPGETFLTLGGGDLEALTYGAFENHLLLKPKAAPVRTNLTIVTNRRTYILDYAVTTGTPDGHPDDLVYSLRFTYPIDAPAMAQRVAADLSDAEAHRPKNIDYWFCGAPGLQPVAVSDDGVHTRLRFGPRAELPAIFVRSDDGSESLLNYSMDGGDLIIHRTARRLILRRGKLVGCIVNKGYSGAGERLDSGTVSPQVHRQTPAVDP